MLVFVHLTQIARNITTFETMRKTTHAGPIMTAVTTGTLSTDGAQIDASGAGPDAHKHAHKKKKGGCLNQWFTLLGIDTFLNVAFQGYQSGKKSKAEKRRQKRANPFTRGVVRNCRDFWLDGPVFGRKRDGTRAMLGGEVVDYASMYEVPRDGMRYRGGYEEVATGEDGEV